jgi:hypothetical protein
MAPAHGQNQNEEEISKKDILRESGVSYGQFYRWKRMALIPEAWFRRRSTFTGQESFLPRGKVMERIRRIQELKDRYSLEEIAEMLSPDSVERTYSPAEVASMGWLSPQAKEFVGAMAERGEWRFLDILCAKMIDELLAGHQANEDDIRLAASVLLRRFGGLNDAAGERHLTLARRDTTTIAALHQGTCLFDQNVRVIAEINLGRLAEDVKVRLRELGG